MINRMKYRFLVLSKLFPYTKGVRRFFLLSLFASVFITLLGFVTPWFYRLFIDEVILGGHFSRMLPVVIGYLSVFSAETALNYLQNYGNYRLVNRTLYCVREKIWRGFFALPFWEYEKTPIGEMKMRIDDDTKEIGSFSGSQSIQYAMSWITLLISLGLLFSIDWRLALFSLIAIPLTFHFDSVISRHEDKLNQSNWENTQKMSSWLYASVQGWREIKALNLERRQERRYFQFLHHYALYYAKWINYWTARVLVIPKIKDEFFMRFGLYFLGGILIAKGELKISDLLVFTVYYEMLSGAIKTVSTTDADLQAHKNFTDRLMDSLAQEDAVTVGGIMPDHSNRIEMEHIYFRYNESERDVIHDLNLCIEKGERVAIVGKSGCGKTTLLKLLTGMIQASSGCVRFSGIDIKKIDLGEMHRRIGFVMQENMLFNTTIRENLRYGNAEATEKELLDACKKAYLYDFITGLPEGLDTVIGEKGIKLSGGQRQRIILARLFLREVDIFLFDEATSALDQYSENIVYDAIRHISDEKTIIVVAHRESSIRLCDRKIVL